MNLLLLHPAEISAGCALIAGRRAEHIRSVHRAVRGDRLRAGIIDGSIGSAEVLEDNGETIRLSYHPGDQIPPTALPLKLVIALPRPKMVNRLLQAVAAMGVKQLVFINSWRVEKSYWNSPQLSDENIREQLLLGLEQGVDTVLPEVTLEPRFKPFVEDRLSDFCADSLRLVAHPSDTAPCPVALQQPATLAIGPEGGVIDYEIELLQTQGFTAVTLGARILRVETAVVALISRLYPA